MLNTLRYIEICVEVGQKCVGIYPSGWKSYLGLSEIRTTQHTSVPRPKGLYNRSQNCEKWRKLFYNTEEEHGTECLWQLGAVSESVELEEGWFLI